MEGDGEVGGTLGKSIVLRSSSPFVLLTVKKHFPVLDFRMSSLSTRNLPTKEKDPNKSGIS